MAERECAALGCSKRSRARGLCMAHYQRYFNTRIRDEFGPLDLAAVLKPGRTADRQSLGVVGVQRG